MQIKTIKPTKDVFVNSCFTFDFEEEIETRHWRQYAITLQIPDLVHSAPRSESFAKIKEALELYPDFDFVYTWKGYCLRNKFFDKVGERAAYEEGLKNCKSKVGLLDHLGQWYHDENQMAEAIRCWIQSCVVQMSTNQKNAAHPFMMLQYVANFLKLRGGEGALYIQKCRIHDIALNATGETMLIQRMARLDQPMRKSVKKALQVLCKQYRVGR